MSSARLAAARALLAVDRQRETLGAALDRERQRIPDSRDRALAGETATGALRWQNELDALLAAASQRPVREIDETARAVLRLGAYQLRHLDRVPAHAVVHESVEVVRALGAPKAAGFVNAVLRSLIRRGAAIALPKRPAAGASRAAQLAYLSVTLSHPAWLVDRWLDRYTFEEVERWCQFNNAAPHITIRSRGRLSHNALLERLDREDLGASTAPYVPDAIRLPPGALGRLPSDVRDDIVVQDEGAQLVARVAGVETGERVLDLCAAPGGKTLVCAEDLNLRERPRDSTLVACDYRAARIALLRQTRERSGLTFPIVCLDARAPLPFGGAFDCVILDAPCSGLGTLRRDPDLKWSRKPGDLPGLAAAESLMIEQAAQAVRPGGRLVYATCSGEPEEDDQVVDQFLAAHPQFSRESASTRCPATEGLLDGAGQLATLPFRDGLDAFFAAVLVRQKAA